jgi:hypothetical protein
MTQTVHAQIDQQLEQAIEAVTQGFKEQNSSKVQQYIHPNYGVIYWSKIGVPVNQTFLTQSKFVFPNANMSDSLKWFYQAPEKNEKPTQSTLLPKMDCETWNKSGLFYKTIKTKPFSELSKINQSLYEIPNQQLQQELERIAPFEQQIIELQYVGKSRAIGDDLHLFFSKIDNKWYLSAFDNAGQCDA